MLLIQPQVVLSYKPVINQHYHIPNVVQQLWSGPKKTPIIFKSL